LKTGQDKSRGILVEVQKASIFTMRKEQAEIGLREEEDRMSRKVRPPTKRKRDAEDLRRGKNIADPATFIN
jgi:hypothetical protein